MITAKPTDYHSVLYRSRLEARWCIFFEQMGLTFLYEPHVYSLKDYGWYLPDFWIWGPGTISKGWLVEVKPTAASSEELEKLMRACVKGHTDGLMIQGSPFRDRYEVDAMVYIRKKIFVDNAFVPWWFNVSGSQGEKVRKALRRASTFNFDGGNNGKFSGCNDGSSEDYRKSNQQFDGSY